MENISNISYEKNKVHKRLKENMQKEYIRMRDYGWFLLIKNVFI